MPETFEALPLKRSFGYAQFPDSDLKTDSVVIIFQAFGTK